MIALVTGASSGIGKDISVKLARKGYDVILVARNINRLEEVKKLVEQNNVKGHIIQKDLSDRNKCIELYDEVHSKFSNIDILVNNAGFGLCGNFIENSIDKELSMIDTNIVALHILTKLFLKDMIKQNSGHILNVASIAGFMPGPLMATYYASKNYVVRLTEAIKEELKIKKSNVKLHLLCPGPVNTNFNETAEVKFGLNGVDSEYVAKYTIKKMFKNRFYIFPGIGIRITSIASKFLPTSMMAKMCYNFQKKKI